MPRDEAKAFRACGPATVRAEEGGAGADGKPKLARIEGVAYTGAVMKPGGWYGNIVVDLAGVRVPRQQRPLLRQHDHDRIVGHTESVTVDKNGIQIAGVLSNADSPHAREIVELAKNGFPWQLSIGANPVRTEFLESGKTTTVNGREVTGPLTISRETELGEVSLVPLGADGDTSAVVSASKGGGAVNDKAMLKAAKGYGNVRAAKYSDDEIDKMSDDEAKAALKECMKGEDPPAEDKAKAKAKAGADEPDGDEDKKAEAAAQKRIQASRKAEADEARRTDAIRALGRKYGVDSVQAEGRAVPFVAHAIEAGWTAEKAELEALRAARPAAGTGGPHLHFASTPEVSEAVLEAAVLHANRHGFKLEDDGFYTEPTPDGKGTVRRVPLALQRETQGALRARYTDQVQQAAHTLFKGRVTLKQVLSLAAQAAGIGRHAVSLDSEFGVRDFLKAWDHSTTIRAEGASTISISNVLANVMNKFSLQGYLFTEQAWRDVCGIRPVNDFKPTKSINLLGDVAYKKLGPSGEIENASLGDQAFANQAEPYGRLLTIPWTHIVNDDLGILGTVPQKLGQGAGLALNDAIWTVWKNMAAGTVNGDDGNAFWRTTSLTTDAAKKAGTAYKPNKTSGGGSALSLAAMATVKALFDNQIDPNGNPLGFDGLKPVLLFGPSNWQTAMNILYAAALVYGGSTAAAAGPNFNAFQGYFTPVMSRYIENAAYVNSATAWWMLFNPVALATIEVSFLNGTDTPTVLQAGPDYQFDRLGISIRGTMPFGVSQQNFRGGVYAVGA